MSWKRTTARRIARSAALPLCLLMVGCSGLQSGAVGRDSAPVPIEAISADIEAELGKRDDVSDVDVYYNDTVTVPASASVDVTMKPGADPHAITDEAVRLIWQSRLNPLSTIRVSVIDPVEPTNGVASSFNLFEDADREALERDYGPHPE